LVSDPISRLNAALEGRYAIERGLGEGGMATFNLATVRTDPDFGVESRERLDSQAGYFAANMRHWDLTPDDQRLLVVGDASAASQQIVVVQNFFEELRQRMGN